LDITFSFSSLTGIAGIMQTSMGTAAGRRELEHHV